MKILHINTSDKGGAATACMRLHTSLLSKGIDSKALILEKTKRTPQTYSFNYWDNTRTRIESLKKGINLYLYDRKLRHRYQRDVRRPHYEIFTYPTTIYDITSHPLYQEADIIQLNWVGGFLDESSFFDNNTKPIVWRMADLYITGGGNHYEKSFPFNAFANEIKENLEVRKKYLENDKNNIHVVPISNWAKEKAKASPFTKNLPTTIIQCGVDTQIFKPYNKELVRTLLNLPHDKQIILFGADNLINPRKGIDLLIKSLENIDRNKNYVCSFGSESQQYRDIHNLGSINDERLLAMLYSAADLFVISSIEDTFGQVLIEALSCGTPVATFPTGGALDVITSQNGVIAKDFTSEALSSAIQESLNKIYNRDDIREDTVKRFNIDDKATEYIKLYQLLLKNKK